MDITVKPLAGDAWSLTDLLGRSMGTVAKDSSDRFNVVPAGHAMETMQGMKRGPFASLDAALAAIEEHTRGQCRMVGADASTSASGADDDAER